MTLRSGNPWIFHRDEIDLLEEEMDEIYSRDSLSYTEDCILKEQIETEEAFENELAALFGQSCLSEAPLHVLESGDCSVPEEPLRDLLKNDVQREPLYQSLSDWVWRVFARAHDSYLKDENSSADFFRVYVNVKMILIKFALAHDQLVDFVAEKEEQLCFLYFKRTLESLEQICLLGDTKLAKLLIEGLRLERRVHDHFSTHFL